jgi:hypothetical protein
MNSAVRGTFMAKLMMSFRVVGSTPTIDDIQTRFSLTNEEIDRNFGVVQVDPEEDLYTILVEESAADKVQPGGNIREVEGPFANPRIEPFGPPEP